METVTPIRDLLFTLLLKVGVASSISALLARWTTFRRVLFTEERDPDQKIKLMLFMTPALIVGVTLRLVGGPSYEPQRHAHDQRRGHEQHQFDFLVGIAFLGEEHAPKRGPPRQQRGDRRRHSH